MIFIKWWIGHKNKIEQLITDRTCAILPVHVYGNICNIEEIARKYGLKVIYDAVHSFGETYKGKSVGAFGDVSCFSFHATKVLIQLKVEQPAITMMYLESNFIDLRILESEMKKSSMV